MRDIDNNWKEKEREAQGSLFDSVGASQTSTSVVSPPDNKEKWCYVCRYCNKESAYLTESALEAKTPKGFVDDKIVGMVCTACQKRERKALRAK